MKLIRAGVAAGLVGGTLDLIAAMVVYPAVFGNSALQIVQAVASGVEGPSAFAAGWRSALLGVCLHFFIAAVAGCVLAAAMTKAPALRRHVLLTGATFGIGVFFFMQLVVVPLSKAPTGNLEPLRLTIGIAIHVLALGAPMALLAKRSLHTDRVPIKA